MNNPAIPHCSAVATQECIEMLGIEEFSTRMHVSTNTTRNWLKRGVLLPGRHYIQNGRIYRFPWSRDFIMQLMQDLNPEIPHPRPKLESKKLTRSRLKLKA
jgi:hypothetical protein